MKITGNTLLVTGGGSGIGRALAEAFHAAGNTVIVAGRRRSRLDEVVAANPGMAALEIDVADAASVAAAGREVVARFPALNVLVANAGIMRAETLRDPAFLADAEAMIATNLLGPIRLTAALLPHLETRPDAAIVAVTSGLAFVPLASTPTYSATKAALHAWTRVLRHQLAATSVEAIEIAPPYVQTTLMGDFQASDPAAMPLADFISETMAILGRDPTPPEVIVERCAPLRFAERDGRADEVFRMLAGH